MTDIEIDDTIELVEMPQDPDPIPVGTKGTVTDIQDTLDGKAKVYTIDWEINRSLSIISPPDSIRKV